MFNQQGHRDRAAPPFRPPRGSDAQEVQSSPVSSSVAHAGRRSGGARRARLRRRPLVPARGLHRVPLVGPV